jgi:putative ABC transport system permease protein
VVSELLLYKFGIHDEADVPGVIGRTLRLELSSYPFQFNSMLFLLGGEVPELTPADEDLLGKIVRRLPDLVARLDLTADERDRLGRLLRRPKTAPGPRTAVVLREEFTITGVLRMPTDEEAREGFSYYLDTNGDVFVPATTAEEMYFRFPANREFGVGNATVRVDAEDHVKEVDDRIRAMGLESYAPVWALERVKYNVMMVSLATSFVAVVALVVAGLGIANTLLMSVLERTHEIGVMKAVGARDRHIQALFVVEGALIGLAGSGLGLLAAWLASYPLDRLGRRLAEQQAQAPLAQSLFVFPWWLTAGVPLFVTLLTVLAAAYPARRAARVNPMTALRHE